MQDENGDTALIKACKNKHVKTLALLLNHNADVTIENKNKKTVMWYAWEHKEISGEKKLEELLIKHGVKPIKGIGDDDVNETTKEGRTALMLAGENGTLEKMQLLLGKGVNVNHQDKFGKTALMLACNNSTAEKVELLVRNGADPNIQDKYGKTALIYVMDDNYYGDSDRKKFDLLLETKNINVNLQTNTGMTALMFACKVTSAEHYYIERLFEKEAKLNIETKKGKNALSFVKDYNTPLKELLLKYRG